MMSWNWRLSRTFRKRLVKHRQHHRIPSRRAGRRSLQEAGLVYQDVDEARQPDESGYIEKEVERTFSRKRAVAEPEE